MPKGLALRGEAPRDATATAKGPSLLLDLPQTDGSKLSPDYLPNSAVAVFTRARRGVFQEASPVSPKDSLNHVRETSWRCAAAASVLHRPRVHGQVPRVILRRQRLQTGRDRTKCLQRCHFESAAAVLEQPHSEPAMYDGVRGSGPWRRRSPTEGARWVRHATTKTTGPRWTTRRWSKTKSQQRCHPIGRRETQAPPTPAVRG